MWPIAHVGYGLDVTDRRRVGYGLDMTDRHVGYGLDVTDRHVGYGQKGLEVKKACWVSETAFISKVASVLRMHRELEETDKPGKQTNTKQFIPKTEQIKRKKYPPK